MDVRFKVDEWTAPNLEGCHSEEGKNKPAQLAGLHTVSPYVWVLKQLGTS